MGQGPTCAYAPCSRKLEAPRRGQRYCSPLCGIRGWRLAHGQQAWRTSIGPAPGGAVSELMVAADLLRRGFEVYRGIHGATSVDLLVKQGRLRGVVSVEVTTGTRSNRGRVHRPRKDRTRFDVLAIVVGDVVIYEPPLDAIIEAPPPLRRRRAVRRG